MKLLLDLKASFRLLAHRLIFGDEEQVRAVRHFERVEECIEALKNCPHEECGTCGGNGECPHCGQKCPDCLGDATCICLKEFTAAERQEAREHRDGEPLWQACQNQFGGRIPE